MVVLHIMICNHSSAGSLYHIDSRSFLVGADTCNAWLSVKRKSSNSSHRRRFDKGRVILVGPMSPSSIYLIASAIVESCLSNTPESVNATIPAHISVFSKEQSGTATSCRLGKAIALSGSLVCRNGDSALTYTAEVNVLLTDTSDTCLICWFRCSTICSEPFAE